MTGNGQSPQVKGLTADQIREDLRNGHFGSLIGAVETGEFECKRSPYQLSADHSKQELAKDVAALANASGGLLVIGLETSKHAAHQMDVVVAVKAFCRELVDVEQYEAIIGSWIYPGLKSISISWFPAADNDSIGVLLIDVPQQERADWPFLVMRHIDVAGRRMESVFGYFERKRSLVDHTSVQQLHTLLRDGHRYSSLGEDLGRIERKLDLIHSLRRKEGEARRPVEWTRSVPNRLARLRESSELSDRPAYTLIACPSWESMPLGLFERRRTDIVSLLKAPPEIRNSGFDLNTGREPRRASDGAWLSVLAGVKALACWDDACLMFLSDGDEYLCWGNEAEKKATSVAN